MSTERERDAQGDRGGTLAASLAGLSVPDPSERAAADFAWTILRRVGVPADAYDTYTLLDTAGGALYVAGNENTSAYALLDAVTPDPEDFEERYRAHTGRSALRTGTAPRGVRTALRTGRARQLALDLSALAAPERAALTAVRSIPRGQMRPVSWLAREASLDDPAVVVGAVLNNPLHVLIPCHRVAHDNGRPCDTAYGTSVGDRLRAAEGIDPVRLDALARLHTRYLGSDTTRVYCHPTCAHARRITPPHQVPFRSAGSARRAGYRPCKSCRPAAA